MFVVMVTRVIIYVKNLEQFDNIAHAMHMSSLLRDGGGHRAGIRDTCVKTYGTISLTKWHLSSADENTGLRIQDL